MRIIDRNSKGDLQQIWETPSLLASFAEMFAQDIAYGPLTRLCQSCQLPFVSAVYQGRYCSRTVVNANKNAMYVKRQSRREAFVRKARRSGRLPPL